jgi:hypothetical protein
MKLQWKKALWSIILLGSVSASAESILGVEGSYSYTDASEPATGTNYTLSTPAFGLRLGAMNDEFRFMFIGTSMLDEKDGGATVTQDLYLATIDYFIPIPTDITTFKPYIGANLGYLDYKYSSVSEGDSLFGGQVGVLFNSSEKVDFDIFVRYYKPQQDDVHNLVQSGLGINYKF